MRYISTIIHLIVFVILLPFCSNSQTLKVGSQTESYYRTLQLLNRLDSSISFTSRPLNLVHLESSLTDTNRTSTPVPIYAKEISSSKLFSLKLLPISIDQQYNSNHPYGWNDASMIPAKGYQNLISGGFYSSFGPLSIQIQPEFNYAQNGFFNTTNITRGATDQPERFGNNSLSNLNWGQSAIQLKFSKIAIKLSNENLWWGPGQRNSLLMSNNAAGFKHISFNTDSPIKSPIGNIEFQFIGGDLENSDFDESGGRAENRYFAGALITYQPKWVPGLFLGLTRSFQAYKSDIKTFADYAPFLTPYQKVNTNDGDPFPRDQISSVYVRWLFPETHAEAYVEFGKNDNAIDFRDFLGSPEHSRAYLFGLRKLIPLNRKEQFINLSGEITQLSQTVDRLVRPAGSWYYHGEVSQGYTHQGQVLGAGTASGGDLQSIEVSWLKNFKTIGLRVERFVRDKDVYEANIGDYNGQSRRWVDFSFAALARWDFKHLLLNAELNYIKSLNYQWIDRTPVGNAFPVGVDKNNFHGRLGISYCF